MSTATPINRKNNFDFLRLLFFKLRTIRLIPASIVITYIFAYSSWHLIEKRMLTYKNLIK
ncbi:hypothetical protein HNP36_002753 [Chryseobacterium shigense]|uniref:Uncharacterized protein n=1 Tax=Chryseobacterium shigense TaxID=297244 RepID=A0A841ND48_9FLAO|nr:hypothetical protein [Chryseobacterium shigense]